MNKSFYYEYLNRDDLVLARNLAAELCFDLGLPVYPALGILYGTKMCNSGIYFEADVNEIEEEIKLDKIVGKKMIGRYSVQTPKPSAESYNAYPLTIYNVTIDEVGDTWYKLNEKAKEDIDCKTFFSGFLYEKNGNVEVGGTFKMIGEQTRCFLVNSLRQALVYRLHEAFPNSKAHFELPIYKRQ